jgi:hypothetical protein
MSSGFWSSCYWTGWNWANTENIRIGLVFPVLAQWKFLYCIDRFDHIKANKSKLINNLFYNLLQFLTFVLYWFPTKNLDRSWTIGIGQTGRIFFSAEDYTNMSYYNCCGIRPKHTNISKRVGEGVITIYVVLDQSTVIFQKGGEGITICVVLRSK